MRSALAIYHEIIGILDQASRPRITAPIALSDEDTTRVILLLCEAEDALRAGHACHHDINAAGGEEKVTTKCYEVTT